LIFSSSGLFRPENIIPPTGLFFNTSRDALAAGFAGRPCAPLQELFDSLYNGKENTGLRRNLFKKIQNATFQELEKMICCIRPYYMN
jgi:methylphosphotriester-DNA--protein-cysteine methyltransferase